MKTPRIHTVIGLALMAIISLSACTGDSRPESLPSALPDTVVVPDGTVGNQVSAPDRGNWSFSLVVADDAAQESALQKMVDEGWTLNDENRGEESVFALSRETQNATLKFTKIAGEPAVIYNVLDLEVASVEHPAESAEPAPTD